MTPATPEPTPQDREEARAIERKLDADTEARPSKHDMQLIPEAIARARHAGEVVERERWVEAWGEAMKALDSIANHPTGWPPPEEENASMRGIAAAAIRSLAPDTEGKP
ncbi:MAG TPA: hypothetical protein VN903_28635 [Polyangia bacterium]|nr:hypothetical protein [Polyangia bacterium]